MVAKTACVAQSVLHQSLEPAADELISLYRAEAVFHFLKAVLCWSAEQDGLGTGLYSCSGTILQA